MKTMRVENEASLARNESAINRLQLSNEKAIGELRADNKTAIEELRVTIAEQSTKIAEQGAKMEQHSKESIKFTATMTGLIIAVLSILIALVQFFG